MLRDEKGRLEKQREGERGREYENDDGRAGGTEEGGVRAMNVLYLMFQRRKLQA